MSEAPIHEQAMALPPEQRRQLTKRLAWSLNMTAEPAIVSVDPTSPKIFTVAGGLGLLSGFGVLTVGLLVHIFGLPHPTFPSGLAFVGVSLVVILFGGTLFLEGLEQWSTNDQFAERNL